MFATQANEITQHIDLRQQAGLNVVTQYLSMKWLYDAVFNKD